MDIRKSDLANIRQKLEEAIGVMTVAYPIKLVMLMSITADDRAQTYHGVVYAPRVHATMFYVPFSAVVTLGTQDVVVTLDSANKSAVAKTAALTLATLV